MKKELPEKTSAQIYRHFQKKKYQARKKFALISSTRKQTTLKKLVTEVEKLEQKQKSSTVRFKEKNSNKTIRISCDVLQELKVLALPNQQTFYLDEQKLKTISIKYFYKKLMRNYINEREVKNNSENFDLNLFGLEQNFNTENTFELFSISEEKEPNLLLFPSFNFSGEI